MKFSFYRLKTINYRQTHMAWYKYIQNSVRSWGEIQECMYIYRLVWEIILVSHVKSQTVIHM